MPKRPPNSQANSQADDQADTATDPDAIFRTDGPIDPRFMMDAVQTLMRTLPLDGPEPAAAKRRRSCAALLALAATNPRDPIEVMLAVQAISAYQAAAACWRIGMNLRQPHGDSVRHIAAAATAARTFDSMLRAMERRQAKPVVTPVVRPAPRTWPDNAGVAILDQIAGRLYQDEDPSEPDDPDEPPISGEWTPEALALAERMREEDRIAEENAGLDIANTEGIRPDGSIVMPEEPTPQQEAYIARRLALMYKREYAENLRNGIDELPKIRPLRTGDLVP